MDAPPRSRESYWLTRFVLLRLLGLIYAVAFLAAAQQLEDVRACRLNAAHHLRHDGDARVVHNLGEVRGEHPTRKWVVTLLPRIAHERLHDPQPVAGCALDVVRRLGEETVDCRADGAVPEQPDADVN